MTDRTVHRASIVVLHRSHFVVADRQLESSPATTIGNSTFQCSRPPSLDVVVRFWEVTSGIGGVRNQGLDDVREVHRNIIRSASHLAAWRCEGCVS